MDSELLKQLIAGNKTLVSEIKGLRQDLKSTNVDHCGPEEALIILGLGNTRYLKYFTHQKIGLLTRRKVGTSYLYSKKELFLLAEKIKSEDVRVPKVKNLPQLK